MARKRVRDAVHDIGQLDRMQRRRHCRQPSSLLDLAANAPDVTMMGNRTIGTNGAGTNASTTPIVLKLTHAYAHSSTQAAKKCAAPGRCVSLYIA